MILIKKGDITLEDAAVIVNAANTQLKGGGGVDGAIHRAAGPSVLEECRKIGRCPTGEAVMTNAGRLKAMKIIHTVGPVWSGGHRHEEDLLRKAYTNSFELAVRAGLRTIAFPAISTGVYGYPKDLAAGIALQTGKKYENYFDEIRYLCFTDDDLEIYRSAWSELSRL